jgi:hypothetical protein
VNKLSIFVFQNVSIVIHFNSILNEILFLILHLHIIILKWQKQGSFFQIRWGPKEFLKRHWLLLHVLNIIPGSKLNFYIRSGSEIKEKIVELCLRLALLSRRSISMNNWISESSSHLGSCISMFIL